MADGMARDLERRGEAAGKRCTWSTLAISVLVAVALSVTATLLLGGGLWLPGAGAPGGCRGGAVAGCPGAAGGQSR